MRFIKHLHRAWRDAKHEGSRGKFTFTCYAPTQLMKSLDYGKDYRYVHDEPDAFAVTGYGSLLFPCGQRVRNEN